MFGAVSFCFTLLRIGNKCATFSGMKCAFFATLKTKNVVNKGVDGCFVVPRPRIELGTKL